MGLFDFIEESTKAVVNTALIPVDAAREVFDDEQGRAEKRIDRVGENVEDAFDSLFD